MENIAVRAQKELVLLHNEDAESPRGTIEWLNARGWCSSHHHIRCPKRVLKKQPEFKVVCMNFWHPYWDLLKGSLYVMLFELDLISYKLYQWCNSEHACLQYIMDPWSCQSKDYEICICCFSAKNSVLRSKSKDWLARNQDNVPKWDNMSICRQLFQWTNTIKNQLPVNVFV
jgi:hypothetical protein